MKTKSFIIALALFAGPFIGAILYKGYLDKKPQPHAQLKLEEVLKIKELHLVRHAYTDEFFIHRKNDPSKPVRAIAHVPVTVTAYLNLKDVQIEKVNDTIRRVVLPAANVHDPSYAMDHLRVTRLRAFQLHAGSDLYSDVTTYIQEVIATRMDSVRAVAIRNHILDQTEAEGKEYIESLLKALGRPDIIVTFNDPEKDKHIAAVQNSYLIDKKNILVRLTSDITVHRMNYIAENINR